MKSGGLPWWLKWKRAVVSKEVQQWQVTFSPFEKRLESVLAIPQAQRRHDILVGSKTHELWSHPMGLWFELFFFIYAYIFIQQLSLNHLQIHWRMSKAHCPRTLPHSPSLLKSWNRKVSLTGTGLFFRNLMHWFWDKKSWSRIQNQTKLYELLSKEQICLNCKIQRFNWMSWAYPCDICAAKVCKKCLRKVASPVDEVQEAAAYMLYPLDTPENQVNNEHANCILQ